MRRIVTIACITLLFISCSGGGVDPGSSANLVAIKYGTFFGECFGYCLAELTIEPTSATLVRSSWQRSKFPDKSEQHPITKTEWDELAAVADIDAMMPLDSITGCPDCADGGGEWIEVQRGGKRKRVVFPYGYDSLTAVQPLLEKVRAIRATFND